MQIVLTLSPTPFFFNEYTKIAEKIKTFLYAFHISAIWNVFHTYIIFLYEKTHFACWVLINELQVFHIRALRNVLYLYDKPKQAHL